MKSSLGDLGLVGSVGSIPAGVAEEISLNRMRNDSSIEASPDVGLVELVLADDFLHLSVEEVHRHGRLHIAKIVLLEVLGVPHRDGDDLL